MERCILLSATCLFGSRGLAANEPRPLILETLIGHPSNYRSTEIPAPCKPSKLHLIKSGSQASFIKSKGVRDIANTARVSNLQRLATAGPLLLDGSCVQCYIVRSYEVPARVLSERGRSRGYLSVVLWSSNDSIFLAAHEFVSVFLSFTHLTISEPWSILHQ